MRKFHAENDRLRSDEMLSLLSRQASWLCLVSAVWYWWMGFMAPLIVDVVTIFIYAFCAYELRRGRHPMAVRWLFFGSTAACLLANSLNLGDESLVWLFFFPLMGGVGVFFPFREPRHSVGIQTMIGTAIAVIAVAHFYFNQTALAPGVTPEFQRAFSVFSICGSALTLLTLIHMNRRQEQAFQQKLESQSKRLFQAEKMSSLGVLSAGIAHEINNPLATISLQLDIMEGQFAGGRIRDTDGEVKTGVDRLRRMSQRIGLIVTGLRNFSRSDATSAEELRLGEVVEQTLSLLSSKLKQGDVGIENRFPATAVVHCGRAGLMQILMNLVLNAAEAVAPLEEKWIRIEGRETDEGYEVAVVDSGRGIPEDKRDKIFLPFYTTKEVGRGTGLGLSLSQTIATSMGGRLFLDASSENTRFVYFQPKAAASAAAPERTSA